MTCTHENGDRPLLPTSQIQLELEPTEEKDTTVPCDVPTTNSSGKVFESRFNLFGVPNLLAMDLSGVDETIDSMEDQTMDVNSLFSNFGKLSVNESSSNYEGEKDLGETADVELGASSSVTAEFRMPERTKDLFFFLADQDGDTPLHICITQENVVKSLQIINRAPDSAYLNIQNNLLQTPLHLATLTDASKLVRRLLCAGADISCQDRNGNTALHLGCIHGHLEIVKQLIKPVTYTEALENKYHLPYMAIPQNMNVKNFEGLTCLHLAVLSQNEDILRLLLEVGADPNVCDTKSGRSALHFAAEQGFLGCVSVLLSYRMTEIDVMNYSEHTPALLAYSRGHMKIVNMLTRFGASYGFYYYDSGDDDDEEDTHSDMDI